MSDIEDRLQEHGHTCFFPEKLALFQEVEERRASNVEDVEEQGEHLTSVDDWGPPTTVTDLAVNSSKWNCLLLQGHGSHLRACDRVDRQHPATRPDKFLRVLSVGQDGLILTKS